MDGIDMEEDTFYYCTELSPRCFVIQRAITFDRGQIERMVGDLEKTQPADIPPPPMMPYWFNAECRNHLINNSLLISPVAPSPQPILSETDLKQQLKAQLEYYFSRENLVTDKYLRCQMDADQYVPISIIAGFRKITQLTSDYNLVLEALRDSNQVEVDEKGEKVRPASRRCTIILREISEEHKEDVEKMLGGGPPYLDLKYGLNDSWYVIYENEETTQKAYLHIQNLDSTFNNKPICARIKAGGPPTAEMPLIERAPTAAPDPLEPPQFTPLMELGQLLASYGYVSAGIYTPDGVGGVQESDVSTQQSYNRSSNRSTHSPRPQNGYGGGTNGYSTHHHNNYQSHNGYSDRKYSYRDGQRRNTGPSYNASSSGAGGRRGGPERNSFSASGTQRRNTGDSRPPRRTEYWNSSPRNSASQNTLSASVNDISHTPAERPRYNSFRREQRDELVTQEFLTVPNRKVEKTEEDPVQTNRKMSGNSTTESMYSFEEKSFPSLSNPKPEPEKPVEKPSFSCVAAGKRYAKPEPKKSYAEKLKQGK